MNRMPRKILNFTLTILVFIILAYSTVVVYTQLNRLFNVNKWVTHTYTVISYNNLLLISILDSDTLERSYFFTKDINSLKQSKSDIKAILPEFVTIKGLTIDNFNQQKLLQELEPLIQQFIFSMEKMNDMFQHNNSLAAQASINSMEHENQINKIKILISQLNHNEENLLKSRTAGSAQFSHRTNVTFFLYSTLSYILLTIFYFSLYSKEKRNLDLQAKNNRLIEIKNKKLLETQKMKIDFLRKMSHEFLSPLNGIIGFVEFIHNEKSGTITPQQKEYLGDILTSAHHLHQLIRNILELQQLESNTMRFNPKFTHLREIVYELCNELNEAITQKSLLIETDIDPSIEYIKLDPKKFKQVIFNFLTNAIKFSKTNGKIYIRVFPKDSDSIKIEVEDNGMGIHEENLNSVFLPFQQIPNANGRKYPGAGIGLALTKRIVEAQGGSIGVRSKVNKGSVFFAILKYKKL